MKKWRKKTTWRYHFTHVFDKWSWCMVPGILSAMNWSFCHFGPFFAPLPPNNSEKIKKNTCGYHHLHKCTKNGNHMLYGSWDIKCDRHNFCQLGHSLPFYNPKNKNFEKMKKRLEISSFYTSVPTIMIIAILFLRYGAWQMQLLFFILGYFLPFSLH